MIAKIYIEKYIFVLPLFDRNDKDKLKRNKYW